MAKTNCPITREEFRAKARPVTVSIGSNTLMAEVKEFSTGSLGWYRGRHKPKTRPETDREGPAEDS